MVLIIVKLLWYSGIVSRHSELCQMHIFSVILTIPINDCFDSFCGDQNSSNYHHIHIICIIQFHQIVRRTDRKTQESLKCPPPSKFLDPPLVHVRGQCLNRSAMLFCVFLDFPVLVDDWHILGSAWHCCSYFTNFHWDYTMLQNCCDICVFFRTPLW